MKRNIYQSLLFGVLSCLALVGCSDDFMEKAPQGALDPSKIDGSKVTELLNAVYAEIPGSDNVFIDGYADNAYSRNSWDSHGVKIQSNTVSGSESFGYGDWASYGDRGNNFSSIRVCNILIDKIDEFDGVNEDVRSITKAEARVMRAWHYTNLTLFYGDVAIVDSVANSFDDGLPREPAEKVREWILDELEDAAQILPEANEPAHFNRAMTYALKARAAYFFGDYATAEEAARYVIDNGGYSLFYSGDLSDQNLKDREYFKRLMDFDALGIDEEKFLDGIFNYRNVWNVDGNSEVIIAKEYMASEDYGDFNRITSFLSPNLSSKQAWATVAPIQDLVDDYWAADGQTKPALQDIPTRIDNYKALREEVATIQAGPDGNPDEVDDNLTFSQALATIIDELPQHPYMDQYLNRDSRLYASIVFPFASVNTFVDDLYFEYIHSINNYGQSGFVFGKMSGGDDVVSVWGDAYYMSGADFPVIRLAEMLLIYAEAHTQTTGYDGTVTTELNKLRDRCGMPDVPAGLSKEDAINFIRRERRIELAGEGLRYFDIRLYEDDKRNGGIKGDQAASVVMKGQTYDPVGNKSALKVWDERLMLMPIPTSSRDKNPLLDQNVGY